ncbi:hypothetical protein BCR43DRAFT_559676 [Syncephalastrum racemosum]|uniref:C2H2-type domain-containing protein n=1 Tax=Syncephalastrum racemosum TaxID=13706 RepID=A0A1X2HTE2_SYNRA|nr:hypothetical protein BCR43DRAFT_559676 [Syncephalastrum racemosum]
MAQPSLKIKLRLTGANKSSNKASPAPSSATSATASTTSSPAPSISNNTHKNAIDTESPVASPASKKAKSSHSRNRKAATAVKPETPESGASTPGTTATGGGGTPASSVTADDNNKSVSSKLPANTPAGNAISSTSRKEILRYKDTKARRWKKSPLQFYTLGGAQVCLHSWQTEEPMALNRRLTEPTTAAEIDQLFSATGNERDFRPFLCTQPGCSKSFTSYDQLQTHETNMHGTKKLICGIDGCHKSFVTPGQLTKHRKMVHFRAARKAKLAAAAAASQDNGTPESSNAAAEAADASTPVEGADGAGSVAEEDELMDDAGTPSEAAPNDEKEDSVDIGVNDTA